jgi:hypothetical protein
MLLDLAHLGTAEFRFHAGGGRFRAFVAASYVVIGLGCIVYGYTHQVPYLRLAGILVLSLGGLIAWLGALKRYRVIADTPTAMLRSAAQGYVELTGTCRSVPEAELLRYGRAPPCLWYHATIVEQERRLGKTHTHTRFECSHDTFVIEDGTGECVIDPEHAEVLSAHQTRWREGSTHYKVKYLLAGDRLYAIGDLRTMRAADGTLDRKADLNTLLRAWKQDRASLLQRFDVNRDGDVDLQEWQRAVAAAGREIDAQHREMRLEPGIHVMRAPNDGRPFLLSNRDPDDLVQRYKLWAWFHLTVFVAASVWAMTLLLRQVQ